MGYTVYIPYTANDSAYTMQTFHTIQDLARWAMTEVLAAPAPAPTPAPPTVTEETAVDSPPLTYEETERLMLIAGCVKKKLAERGLEESDEVYPLFVRLFRKHIPYVLDQLEMEMDMEMETLPEEFWTYHMNPNVNTQSMYVGGYRRKHLTLTSSISVPANTYIQQLISAASPQPRLHPFISAFMQIHHYFETGAYHVSWDVSNSPTLNGILWNNADKITEHLIGAWWSGQHASAEVLEFMIKVWTISHCEFWEASANIGSDKFYTTFQTWINTNASDDALSSLPTAFLVWASSGVQHRHCKKALEELGILQIRRAKGQQFIGITPLGKDRISCMATNTELYAVNELLPSDVYDLNIVDQAGTDISMADGLLERPSIEIPERPSKAVCSIYNRHGEEYDRNRRKYA